MIELQRHIEILLLDNDCVIVPSFGGFVTHYMSARYSKEEQAFLPPQRTLGFNPQLHINDSLLVQSYVNAYDISYPEALRRIENEVEELKTVLRSEGSYTLDDIGVLSVNSDGNYQFEPCEAGILSPELYGLGDLEFMTLKDARGTDTPSLAPQGSAVQPTEQPSLLEFTDSDDTQEGHAIEIKMSWIRNAVAVAAAIAVFFLMATPIANSDLGTQTMSQLQGNLLYRLMPQDTNVVPATPVADKEALPAGTADTATATAEKEVQLSEQAVTVEEPAPATKPYCIVLASQVKQSNAENYVNLLHKRGISDAEVYVHNHIVRVVCGAFATETEAYRQLNKLNDDEEFAEAWVYKKPAEA